MKGLIIGHRVTSVRLSIRINRNKGKKINERSNSRSKVSSVKNQVRRYVVSEKTNALVTLMKCQNF